MLAFILNQIWRNKSSRYLMQIDQASVVFEICREKSSSERTVKKNDLITASVKDYYIRWTIIYGQTKATNIIEKTKKKIFVNLKTSQYFWQQVNREIIFENLPFLVEYASLKNSNY